MIVGRRYNLIRKTVNVSYDDCEVLHFNKEMNVVVVKRENYWKGLENRVIQLDGYRVELIPQYKCGEYVIARCKNNRDYSFSDDVLEVISEEPNRLIVKNVRPDGLQHFPLEFSSVNIRKLPQEMYKFVQRC